MLTDWRNSSRPLSRTVKAEERRVLLGSNPSQNHQAIHQKHIRLMPILLLFSRHNPSARDLKPKVIQKLKLPLSKGDVTPAERSLYLACSKPSGSYRYKHLVSRSDLGLRTENRKQLHHRVGHERAPKAP